MTEAIPSERCACPEQHPTADGRCVEPSIRSEDPGDSTLAKYTWCGCCMADCPDVHPNSDRNLGVVRGSTVMAKEYVDRLPEEQQQQLRDLAERGELRIAPQSEIGLPDPDRIRVLRSALRHTIDYPDESE
ncbi:hypothetical protein [Mycobacterium sp. Aquia_213]|uniref:hypothetical protein n=1 Tax=Mycobacterium sp. Aquia_213 TaxID=2991728 RepID=UPI00226F234B|nr:hypothetical protein [Mycobacterium sp. Aquia_213]WAC89705.1 hypothetical protein LMQ14_17305 [Mycobacterium sp. Aquia_213]